MKNGERNPNDKPSNATVGRRLSQFWAWEFVILSSFGFRHPSLLRRLERDIELSHAALDPSWGLPKPNWAGQFSLFFFTVFGYG